MNLIVLTRRGRPYQLNLARPLAWGGLLSLGLLVAGSLFMAGYGTALWQSNDTDQPAVWRQQLSSQAQEVARAKQSAQTNIDALSAKVGQLQAHIIRLDALGQQLTHMAGLKRGEFNFDEAPAEGGPDLPAPTQHVSMQDFMTNLDQVQDQIRSREQQFSVLENLMMNRNVKQQALPSGPPVKVGYESSPFGMRIDPFTGELSFHPGIDFAGTEGEAVEAVAPGVVTWAGARGGYGNMIEIDHGNGYATRYGHNETILVHVGQVVKKGQEIALMGSTGRSTGPHVHLEVLYNGKQINPAQFVHASGRSKLAAASRNLD
ncbi:MAG TPA: M23 family metallopeptidase [Gammaproteobacteria bacterium]|jgi:murein DD-endopeptidase MepM/ murein hydrolase activator NlpD|nr:M23 family metallopeptidase [Gammaproteobacteria bacterium]